MCTADLPFMLHIIVNGKLNVAKIKTFSTVDLYSITTSNHCPKKYNTAEFLLSTIIFFFC